jgi:hypothetical protein
MPYPEVNSDAMFTVATYASSIGILKVLFHGKTEEEDFNQSLACVKTECN